MCAVNTDAGVSFAAGLVVELPKSHADVMWYRAMMAAVLTRDGHVHLGGDNSWPDMASPLLFVRHFYEPCWEKVMASGESKHISQQRKFVVMGTPGIGKSAFGLYVLWRALRAGRTVIYKTRKRDGKAFLFRDGRVFDVQRIVSLPEISEPSTILIVDGMEAPSENAFTVLITSPLRERWKEFVKTEGVQQLVFPVFSLKEVRELRAVAFESKSGCDETSVMERYAKWGGSVRHVLTHPDPHWQLDLASNAANMTLKHLKLSCGLEAKNQAAIAQHNVLHLKAVCELDDCTLRPADAGFYDFSHGELASLFVQELVYKQLRENEADDLFTFLRTSVSNPALAAFRGVQFELFALHTLAAGGRFKLKRLGAGDGALKSAHLELEPSSVRSFSKLSEVVLSGGLAVWKPLSVSFCAIDAILCAPPLVMAANATVSVVHPLHLTNVRGGLDTIASALKLPKDREISFLWIVPDDTFEKMTDPSPLKISGKALSSVALLDHSGGKRVVQYALSVPIPSSFHRHGAMVDLGGGGKAPDAKRSTHSTKSK